MNNPDCGCPNKNVGNPVIIWPGWVTNDARNNGADVNPIPIVPWRHGNAAATQVQLSNGWQNTSYGKRLSYDSYLRLLYASNSSDQKRFPGISNTPTSNVQPSSRQLASMNRPSTSTQSGAGRIANGVDISGRALN